MNIASLFVAVSLAFVLAAIAFCAVTEPRRVETIRPEVLR